MSHTPSKEEQSWQKLLPHKVNFEFSIAYKQLALVCRPTVLFPNAQLSVNIPFSLSLDNYNCLDKTKAWFDKKEERETISVDGNECYYSLMVFSASRYEFKKLKDEEPATVSFPYETKYSFNSNDYKDVTPNMPIDLTADLKRKGIKTNNALNLKFTACPNEYWICVYLVFIFPPAPTCKAIVANNALKQTEADIKVQFFDEENDSVQCLVLSLICPVLCSQVSVPARGVNCDHFQSFDLFNYLLYYSSSHMSKCPLCGKDLLESSASKELIQVSGSTGKLRLEAVASMMKLRVCELTQKVLEEYERISDKEHFQCVIDNGGKFHFEYVDQIEMDSDEDEDGIIVVNKIHKERSVAAKLCGSVIDLTEMTEMVDLTME